MVSDTKKLWESCLAEIELSISKANFTTWFKNTQIVKEEEGVLFIGVPNDKTLILCAISKFISNPVSPFSISLFNKSLLA